MEKVDRSLRSRTRWPPLTWGGTVDPVRWYESQRLGGRMMYEPEQFPGLIYRMEEPRAVAPSSPAESWSTRAPGRGTFTKPLTGFLRGWRKTGAYFTQKNKRTFKRI